MRCAACRFARRRHAIRFSSAAAASGYCTLVPVRPAWIASPKHWHRDSACAHRLHGHGEQRALSGNTPLTLADKAALAHRCLKKAAAHVMGTRTALRSR